MEETIMFTLYYILAFFTMFFILFMIIMNFIRLIFPDMYDVITKHYFK